VCKRLGLSDVEVFAGKVTPRMHREFAGIITRAVASIPETLERTQNALRPGGKMLFMKGPDCSDEIAEAATSHADRFRLVADHAYEIPGTAHLRRLVVYQRLDVPGSRSSTASCSGVIREASSESNPSIRLCRDVLTGRGVRKHGKAILAGPRLVSEVLARFPERVEAWLTDTKGPAPPIEGIEWIRMADPLFKSIDISGTHAPLALVTVPEMPEWSDDEPWPDGCTLFVPFQDPENVGAVIRSAAAFEAARVVLLREAAHPFHPRSARAAGPALFQVPLWHGPSIEELRSNHVPMIALATDGSAIASEPFPDRFGLIPGLEGPGLPQHLREGPRRRIPIAPGVESLNAATATAIALHAWRAALP
jgi:tRNA G18 (ribose-2'-O)-methylase SpoU